MTEIERIPGIQFRELQGRLKLGDGTLSYHLHRLKRDGFTASLTVNGRPHFFVPDARVAQSSLLLTHRDRDVLAYVRGHPGLSEREVAGGLGLTQGTVSLHMRRLASAGSVCSLRDGRRLRWWPRSAAGF